MLRLSSAAIEPYGPCLCLETAIREENVPKSKGGPESIVLEEDLGGHRGLPLRGHRGHPSTHLVCLDGVGGEGQGEASGPLPILKTWGPWCIPQFMSSVLSALVDAFDLLEARGVPVIAVLVHPDDCRRLVALGQEVVDPGGSAYEEALQNVPCCIGYLWGAFLIASPCADVGRPRALGLGGQVSGPAHQRTQRGFLEHILGEE